MFSKFLLISLQQELKCQAAKKDAQSSKKKLKHLFKTFENFYTCSPEFSGQEKKISCLFSSALHIIY